jgi:hypothetical protein
MSVAVAVNPPAANSVPPAAFDATDTDRLQLFFSDLPGPVDHVMVSAGGPHYLPLEGWTSPRPAALRPAPRHDTRRRPVQP